MQTSSGVCGLIVQYAVRLIARNMATSSLDSFMWDGSGPLMHWSRPATTAFVYLACCVAHNSMLPSGGLLATSASTLVDKLGIVHNLLLVAFSVVVFWNASTLFVDELHRGGIYNFLCPLSLRPFMAASNDLFIASVMGSTSRTMVQRARCKVMAQDPGYTAEMKAATF